eukprot:g31112.t1
MEVQTSSRGLLRELLDITPVAVEEAVNATWHAWVQPRLATKALSELAARRKGQVAAQVLAAMQKGKEVLVLLGLQEREGEQWSAALQLFKDMGDVTIKRIVISFNSAVSACEKGREWQRALLVLKRLPFDDLRPSVISFNSAISACETSGYWRAALQLVRLMMFIELTPTAVTCSSAISACDKGERWRLSELGLGLPGSLAQGGQSQ